MVPLTPAPGDGVHGLIQLAVPNLTGKEAEYTAQAIANGYIGGTNSIWPENFANDAVDTSLPT